jgi:hypothetical protein
MHVGGARYRTVYTSSRRGEDAAQRRWGGSAKARAKTAFAPGHGLLPNKRAWSLGCDRKHPMARRPEPVKSLLTCPKCKLELRLLGIETESTSRDLYTFECSKCGSLEVRGVKVK